MVGFLTTLDPQKDQIDAVLRNIAEHAAKAASTPDNYQAFGVFVTDDETGEVIGGASGYALFEWMFIQYFSLPEALRGKGMGAELMNRVEALARERGLTGMWLDTFSFQARPFYEKLGFEVFGVIDDHPKGAQRFFMRKRLTGRP